MRKRFNSLKVSHKLMLVSIFFIMPDSLMLYMVIKELDENIHFARLEQKGNEYQRPLEALLEHLPEHCSLARAIHQGGAPAVESLTRKQAQVDAALERLEAIDAKIGAELQFTDEGLAKRKREHCRVRVLKEEWQALKNQLTQLSPAACVEQHRHLLADVRTMITHAGDLSNLILDPDLDTYYLMDVTLLALPQAQERFVDVTTRGESALRGQTLSHEDRLQLGLYAGLLRESDLNRVVSSTQTALNEDPNFYGTSRSLQTRLQPLVQEYTAATEAFVTLTTHVAESEQIDTTAEEYVRAGERARTASFKLWRVATQELDTLLQKRIDSFAATRRTSLELTALALVAAAALVTFITRSISGPLRRQAEALQQANESLQREIAERKQVEAELRNSERQLSTAQQIAHLGSWELDLATDILSWSDENYRIHGLQPQEWVVSFEENLHYIHPEDRALFTAAMQKSRREGIPFSFEHRIICRDQTERSVHQRGEAIVGSDGTAIRLIGTTQDVTEKKRAEETRQALEMQMRHAQKMESIGQLAAGIAHEINTPTQYIGDNIRFLKDAFKDLIDVLENHQRLLPAARQRQIPEALLGKAEAQLQQADLHYLTQEIPNAIQQSLEGVDRVTKIVRAMKDFSHPGSDEKTPLDLNHAIESTLTVCHNEWRYVAEVVTEFDPSLPLAPCLPGEINQTILNLIVNAAHAIGDVVGDGSKGKGSIRVTTRRDGPWVEIRICDSGTGIPEKARAKVFDPFFTTKGVGKGTGQGLAIAHAVVVEKHGGTITFETETGVGTTFIIRLPLTASVMAGVKKAA